MAAIAAWNRHPEPVCNLNANEAAFTRQLDISVCTVLAQLTMRYANQYIGIDIVQYASLNKKALETVSLREKKADSEFQIFSQNTITFNSIRTLPEVLFNTICMLKIFATQTTAESFVV